MTAKPGVNTLLQTYPSYVPPTGQEMPVLVAGADSPTAKAANKVFGGDVDTAAEAQTALEAIKVRSVETYSVETYNVEMHIRRVRLIFWAALKTLVVGSSSVATWKLFKIVKGIYRSSHDVKTKVFGITCFGGMGIALAIFTGRFARHSWKEVTEKWKNSRPLIKPG